MAKNTKGSKFHPARISGHQKFLNQQRANKDIKDKIREFKIKPLDLSKGDWTI